MAQTRRSDERSRRHFLKVSSTFGLSVAVSPRTIVEAFTTSKNKNIQEENTMTQTSAAQTTDLSSARGAILDQFSAIPERQAAE